MQVTINHRPPWGRRYGPAVTLTMPLTEFRELVEWIALLDPCDGCTQHLRTELNRIEEVEADYNA